MLSRAFKSGNSLAIRIPKELAIVSPNQDVEIEQVGDTLVMRPVVRRKLTGLAETFAMFSPDFMAEGREFHEQKERQWDDVVQGSSVHQDPAMLAIKSADGK